MKGRMIIEVLAAFWSGAVMGFIPQGCAKTEGGGFAISFEEVSGK